MTKTFKALAFSFALGVMVLDRSVLEEEDPNLTQRQRKLKASIAKATSFEEHRDSIHSPSSNGKRLNYNKATRELFGDPQKRVDVFLNIAQAIADQALEEEAAAKNSTKRTNLYPPTKEDMLPDNLISYPTFLYPNLELSAMKPKYRTPNPDWTNALPDITVAGFAKAGTSHLYRVLESHPDTQNFGSRKEDCSMKKLEFEQTSPNNPEKFYDSLQEIAQKIRKKRQVSGKLLLNGCIKVGIGLERLQYMNNTNLLDTANTAMNAPKMIVLFRDPADHMWAVWNFWHQDVQDVLPPLTGNAAVAERHYRSPELFHEYIASGNKIWMADKMDKKGPHQKTRAARTFQVLLGHNVLFLRNEDMLPDRISIEGGLLDRLANFTGLSRLGLESDIVHEKTNCGSGQHGADTACNSGLGEAYPIAGGREMLPATRKLIYIRYANECKTWKEEFGIDYPDCVQALDPYRDGAKLRNDE